MYTFKMAVFGFFTLLSVLEIFMAQNMFLAIIFGLMGMSFLQDSRK